MNVQVRHEVLHHREYSSIAHFPMVVVALPNHSIERTSSGKLHLPAAAAHVKR
jgi:hypothetical protein